jgi:alpha-methylacyl-CoA racemase
MSGPLAGIKVVELGGIGPGPFAAMMLSDFGADVVRIDRPAKPAATEAFEDATRDVLLRGRRSLVVDLKRDEARDAVLALIDQADVLIDPYRPGVVERLGIGPDVCTERNPRLVYGRITGWGQDGPLAHVAAHDLNYVALTGPLAAMGRVGEPPAPALNLIGDFGGGGMLLAFGVVTALVERAQSGRGQVIDAAMIDGIATLSASIVGFMNMGAWSTERGNNLLDGSAHWYDTYETSDGRFVSIGSLEPQFYALLLELLDLPADDWPQLDKARWPELKQRLRELFVTRTREDWCELLEGTDVCFAPVLDFNEAVVHPHMAERGVYANVHGALQPQPAPRLSRTPGAIQSAPPEPGSHTAEVLAAAGLDAERVQALLDSGAAVQASPAAV